MKKIEISLPSNIKSNTAYLFEKKKIYFTDKLKINRINNVFISHEGLCLKNFLLVENSHFNLKGNEDNTFYLKFWEIAFEQYIVSTFGKSLTKKHLETGEYLHIYTKWFGYFFWLTDCLPKLIKTKDSHSNLKLIYPENWKKIKFVNETLSLFPNLSHEIIPKGVHLQVKKLCLPETRKWSNAIDIEEIHLIRNFLFNELDQQNISINFGEKIYISRNKANRRKPSNNKEVENIIEKFGFRSISLEDFSFLEQISIMRNAKYVIGLHGAGLANIQFIKPKGGVLEISPKIIESEKLRIPFWRIANIIDSDFFIQFCKIEKLISNDIYDSNLIVGINELEENIKKLIN